jgi:hypothetical protein
MKWIVCKLLQLISSSATTHLTQGGTNDAETYVDAVYKGGEFIPRSGMKQQIGTSHKFNNHPKSKRFIIESSHMNFLCHRRTENTAHNPHIRSKIEICAVIKGRKYMNYVMSGFCRDYFDVLHLKEGQVVVLPGIHHTASPDAKEDGEHMCMKLFPCDEKVTRSLDITKNRLINLPGYESAHKSGTIHKHRE